MAGWGQEQGLQSTKKGGNSGHEEGGDFFPHLFKEGKKDD